MSEKAIQRSPYITSVLYGDEETENKQLDRDRKKCSDGVDDYKSQLCWRNIVILSYYHLAAFYGAYLALTSAKAATVVFALFLHYAGLMGITAGDHRLFAHKAYKATWQLRLLLMLMETIAFQGGIHQWVRDHRAHHKFSESNADPHNAKRGFFFSHIGWLLCYKHPDLIEKGKSIDMSDLLNDPIVRFQHRHYWKIMPIICFGLPAVIPVYFWGESWNNAYHVAGTLRYVVTLHITWLVNSVAHIFGNKPYDRHMYPAENKLVSFLALGEGWHNYHHAFPWDYKTSELGLYKYNFTTAFIDFFAKIGWAYDLKTVSRDTIKKRAERTGDGTYSTLNADVEKPSDDHCRESC